MNTGSNIQSLRKKAGMSQEELAEKLGVSRQAVSKWEMGQSLPETEKLIALSKIFSVPLSYFITGEEQENAVNTDELLAEYLRSADVIIRKKCRKNMVITTALCTAICVIAAAVSISTASRLGSNDRDRINDLEMLIYDKVNQLSAEINSVRNSITAEQSDFENVQVDISNPDVPNKKCTVDVSFGVKEWQEGTVCTVIVRCGGESFEGQGNYKNGIITASVPAGMDGDMEVSATFEKDGVVKSGVLSEMGHVMEKFQPIIEGRNALSASRSTWGNQSSDWKIKGDVSVRIFNIEACQGIKNVKLNIFKDGKLIKTVDNIPTKEEGSDALFADYDVTEGGELSVPYGTDTTYTYVFEIEDGYGVKWSADAGGYEIIGGDFNSLDGFSGEGAVRIP